LRLSSGLVRFASLAGNRERFRPGQRESRASVPPFCSGNTQKEKEEEMVKQRFRVLFRRWFFTVMKFCGPILLFELFVAVRQHFQYVPPSISDLLMGALLAFLLTVVLAVGVRRVVVVQAAQVTRFLGRATAMLQKLLES